MKESKRGQVTIFVIIAILIVAGIVAFFIFRDKLNFGLTPTPAELQPITEEIQLCVESTLQDGAKLAGLQGGYVIPPSNALETNFSYIAYGYYLGQSTLASKTKIESEIAKYIELTLPFCFDVSNFPNYKINTGNPKASVKISPSYISASVNYRFTATKAETSYRVGKSYKAEYKVKLGDMHSVAQEIIAREVQNPNNLDFTYLNSFNYDISILNEGNNILVYSITDYKLNSGGSYTFRFANKIR
jgi:hypothetical protein